METAKNILLYTTVVVVGVGGIVAFVFFAGTMIQGGCDRLKARKCCKHCVNWKHKGAQ